MVFKLDQYNKFEDIKFEYSDDTESPWMLGTSNSTKNLMRLQVEENQTIRHIYQKKMASLDLYLNGIMLTNGDDEEIGRAEWGAGSWVGPYTVPEGWSIMGF